ncbi:MAG: class I SAM-dependent RNA methyltransferase [Saprospiraceae bacterium]
MRLLAKTMEGLEDVLAEEIRSLGGQELQILKRAVAYTGDKALLYKSNYLLRTALKILVFVKEFEIKNENDLYLEIKNFAWEEYFSLEETFAIDSVVNSDMFRHANFISLKAKDAIVDRYREKYGARPNVDKDQPTIRINLHVRQNTVTLSMDSSGRSLHMRGYRLQQTEAPINEVLAAGLILLSGWDKKTTLIDPMCGSGTILCEAARISANIPPHPENRDFAFSKWRSFDDELWRKIISDAHNNIVKTELPKIMGFDYDSKALDVSKTNIHAAGLTEYITLEQEDFFYQEGIEDVMLIFNPPYDGRLKEDDVTDFYKSIGDKLKLSFPNSTAWIISGHILAMKHLGLRASAKKNLLNGSIPSVFCRFDMYKGSKKQKWKELYKNTSSDEK